MYPTWESSEVKIEKGDGEDDESLNYDYIN